VLVARRDAFRSPDGRGYLTFDCDGPPPTCGPSKAIFQDMKLGHGSAPSMGHYVFGGKAASLDGQTGRVRFVVGQLDAAGHWLRTDAVSATINGSDYTGVVSDPVVLRHDAVSLRYLVWVNGERYTVKAGELFVEPRP